MSKIPVSEWVASLKAMPGDVRNRELFLARSKHKDNPPSVAGFPMLGLGGSCGKPAFQLPYTLRWTHENLELLEQVAAQFDCFVEYGAYPHLKLNDSGQEIAAVQDWSAFGVVFVRPGYEKGEEVLKALATALEPAALVA
jgi:uncharacterized protein YecE (DUF72 family)